MDLEIKTLYLLYKTLNSKLDRMSTTLENIKKDNEKENLKNVIREALLSSVKEGRAVRKTFDLYGLTEGISPDDPQRRVKLCERFIEEIKKMSGTELSSFLTSYNVDLVVPGIVIEFKVPLTSEFLTTFFRECKRDVKVEKDKK